MNTDGNLSGLEGSSVKGTKDVWLTTSELAERLKIATSTLWQWNHRGYGPPPARIGGKLRYKLETVERWEREQERRQEAPRRAR